MNELQATGAPVALRTADLPLPQVHIDKPIVKAQSAVESYKHVGARLKELDAVVAEGTKDCGILRTKERYRSTVAGWSSTVATVASAGVGLFEYGLLGAAASGVAVAIGAAFSFSRYGKHASKKERKREPEAESVDRLIAMVRSTPAKSSEAIALGRHAAEIIKQLDAREVKGWKIRLALEGFAERATNAPTVETQADARWTALRDAITRRRDIDDAFNALTEDEKKEFGPYLCDHLFEGEAPRAAISFEDGRKLFELFSRYVDQGALTTREVAHLVNLPEAPETVDFDAITKLRDDFDTAAAECLRLRTASAASIDGVFAIVDVAGRDALDVALLGYRVRGLLEKLDAQGVYGTQQRHDLKTLAAACKQSPELEERAAKLSEYLKVMKHDPKTGFGRADHYAANGRNRLNGEQLVRAVKPLGADTANAAQRALNRYFKGEEPIAGNAKDMQQLGMALTKLTLL